MVLDRAAGETFLRTRSAIFPGLLLAEIFGITDGPLHEQMTRNIINVNGAAHSRLRGLVNPALSPRAVERYRPAMREILADLWDGSTRTRPLDFVAAIAKPYPSRMIARVMGAPEPDAPRLHDWSMWIQRQFDPVALADPDQRRTIEHKVAEFYAWVRPLIARRRDDPDDDLISPLIAAEAGGRAPQRRRAREPRAEHPRRRCRHHPEPARARDPAACRRTRSNGRRSARTQPGWPQPPPRRRFATSRSPR